MLGHQVRSYFRFGIDKRHPHRIHGGVRNILHGQMTRKQRRHHAGEWRGDTVPYMVPHHSIRTGMLATTTRRQNQSLEISELIGEDTVVEYYERAKLFHRIRLIRPIEVEFKSCTRHANTVGPPLRLRLPPGLWPLTLHPRFAGVHAPRAVDNLLTRTKSAGLTVASRSGRVHRT